MSLQLVNRRQECWHKVDSAFILCLYHSPSYFRRLISSEIESCEQSLFGFVMKSVGFCLTSVTRFSLISIIDGLWLDRFDRFDWSLVSLDLRLLQFLNQLTICSLSSLPYFPSYVGRLSLISGKLSHMLCREVGCEWLLLVYQIQIERIYIDASFG